MAGELRAIVEALLFAAEEPLPPRRAAGILGEASEAELRAAVDELNAGYAAAGHALQVVEVAGGWRLLTRAEFAPWIARLLARPARVRLTGPSLETLAIVAYKQPVARAELEEIRGVNVEGVLRTLVERDLVTIVGRDEGLGRPLLYGTTRAFLTYFGLNTLDDLPRLDELEAFLSERELAALRAIEAAPENAPRDGRADGFDGAVGQEPAAGEAKESSDAAADEHVV
ncbi:MAG: SMC-Scp complex subunit ScpB [Gemmatimonadota bacterium]